MLYAAVLRSLSRRTQIKDKGEEYRAGCQAHGQRRVFLPAMVSMYAISTDTFTGSCSKSRVLYNIATLGLACAQAAALCTQVVGHP